MGENALKMSLEKTCKQLGTAWRRALPGACHRTLKKKLAPESSLTLQSHEGLSTTYENVYLTQKRYQQ